MAKKEKQKKETPKIEVITPELPYHEINWDQVQTVDDVKCILKIFQMKVREDNPNFDIIKHLVK